MHNNFDDIEGRLRDFQDFEFGVTNDIWDKIEQDIMMDSSLSNLNNLEFDVTDDIWGGIESELGSRNRRPAVWWAPGIVAGLLLLTLVGTQFTKFNKNSELAVQDEVKQPIDQEVVTTQNIQNSTKESSTIDDFEDNSGITDNAIQDAGEENISNTYLAQNSVTNKVISSSGNGVEQVVDNNVNTNNVFTATTGLIAVNGITGSLNNTSSDKLLDEIIETSIKETPASRVGGNNNIVVTINADENNQALIKDVIVSKNKSTENALVKNQDDSFLPFTISKDKANQEEIIVEDISDEEVESVLTADKEDEEQEEAKRSKWKLIALGGMGNFLPIEKTFDVVKPALNEPTKPTKPKPIDGDDKQNIVPTEDDKPVEEGDGINYVKYSIPVSLALNGEYALSNKVGIRTGLNYTKLLYTFEVYGSGNKVDLHYLSIPVIGVFSIKDGAKIRFSGSIGTRIEKMFDSRYLVVEGDDVFINSKIAKVENSGVNIALSTGLDVEYKLTSKSSIVLNTQAVNYISTDIQEEFDRNVQQIWPEINLGYSINF